MILEFIKQHKILDIGCASPGELFAEMILDLPFDFVDAALNDNYYISRINWWERARIQSGSLLGFGGPRDPRAPQKFFFSETSLCKEFDLTTTTDEYYDYINSIQTQYKNICLVPSFELRHKKR